MKSRTKPWIIPAALLAAAPLLALAEVPGGASTAPADNPAEVRLRQNAQAGGGAEQGRTVAFVGIGTGSVDPTLASHLGTAEGLGLIVQLVMDDSPAAKAGIQANDVLVKFNDQLLVNAAQLTTLIQMQKPGDTVSFTLMRKGTEQTVEVELGEQTLRPPTMLQLLGQDGQRLRFRPMEIPMPEVDLFNEEIIQEMEANLARLRQDLGENHPQLRDVEQKMRMLRDRKALLPFGAPFVAEGTVVISDTNADGSAATLTRDDTGLRFKFTQDGEVVFEGPVESEEQREQLTDPQRERLESLLEMMPTFEMSGPR